MNRIDEIDKFLKEAAISFTQNPNIQITDNLFYASLMYYDVYTNELDEDISSYFPEWCEYFKYKTNLDVYYSMKQRAFLQFRNCNSQNSEECFKLYLSLPKENFYESVTMIFDYIEQNKIQTLSKVANCIRSDSVVLRIVNKEDAINVINFVNQNIKNTKKVNPFLLNCGNVGLAYDGNLSYNATLSFFLSEYYKQSNDLSDVSGLSFNQFIGEKIQNIFINKSELDSFLNTDFFKKNQSRFKSESDCLANYYRIIMLINESLKPDMNYDKYFDYVELCQKNSKTKDLEKYFDNVLKQHNKRNEKEILDYNSDSFEKINLLYDACLATTQKYNIEQTYYALKEAINGNYNGFTNGDSEYRRKLIDKINSNEIEQLCRKYMIISEYEIKEGDIFRQYCNIIMEELKELQSSHQK